MKHCVKRAVIRFAFSVLADFNERSSTAVVKAKSMQGFADFLKRHFLLQQQFPRMFNHGCTFRIALDPVVDLPAQFLCLTGDRLGDVAIPIRCPPAVTALNALRLQPTANPDTQQR